MGAGPVRGTWRWVVLILVLLAGIGAGSAYLTAERPGGRMDPNSTGPAGAHALVTLLRSYGVEVVVAQTVGDAENAAHSGTLLLVAQTQFVTDDALLRQLVGTPADLLVVEPTARARAALTPALRSGATSKTDLEPDCDLREADRAGSVQFGQSNTYQPTGRQVITSCYAGALVRYRDGTRTVTVVGNTGFMTNGGLSRAGNAALAMNLAGDRPRMVWFAPQHPQGESRSGTRITDLIPDNVTWMVWQLWLAVLLLALWKGRRVGPLVAEDLPVVVRASETVEGRGRLYRSRRARDRAAHALRNATLQRLLPRLGLTVNAPAAAVAVAVAQRCAADPQSAHHKLFGPPPVTDAELVDLAHALDDIERQVTHV
jgi:hypothetical protein